MLGKKWGIEVHTTILYIYPSAALQSLIIIFFYFFSTCSLYSTELTLHHKQYFSFICVFVHIIYVVILTYFFHKLFVGFQTSAIILQVPWSTHLFSICSVLGGKRGILVCFLALSSLLLLFHAYRKKKKNLNTLKYKNKCCLLLFNFGKLNIIFIIFLRSTFYFPQKAEKLKIQKNILYIFVGGYQGWVGMEWDQGSGRMVGNSTYAIMFAQLVPSPEKRSRGQPYIFRFYWQQKRPTS